MTRVTRSRETRAARGLLPLLSRALGTAGGCAVREPPLPPGRPTGVLRLVQVLVLGGTAWLGGAVAAAAERLGHDVVCLARGTSGRVPPGASLVRADRDEAGAYDGVAGRRWDVVVDVSRQPGHVRRAVRALRDVGTYALVSTGNVYADQAVVGLDEAADLLPPLDGDLLDDMARYGEAKVACEQAVLDAYGEQGALVARPGLIGGPGDLSDRTGYWPSRFARPAADDGAVLVPDAPGALTQVVDVRDLAEWLVTAPEAGVRGVFNATGDARTLTEHLEIARTVAGHRGPLVPARSDWLLEHDVAPWTGPHSLPLWLPDPAWAGLSAVSGARARAAGLRSRPLEQTLADTLAWERTREPGRTRTAGLSDADERALIAELRR